MLVEVEVAPMTALPLEDAAFDVAVVDDTGDLINAIRPDDRTALMRELLRVLRLAGRVIVIGAVPQAGLGGLFKRGAGSPSFAASGAIHELLSSAGFRPVRTLAERDGLVFVEAAKPR